MRNFNDTPLQHRLLKELGKLKSQSIFNSYNAFRRNIAYFMLLSRCSEKARKRFVLSSSDYEILLQTLKLALELVVSLHEYEIERVENYLHHFRILISTIFTSLSGKEYYVSMRLAFKIFFKFAIIFECQGNHLEVVQCIKDCEGLQVFQKDSPQMVRCHAILSRATKRCKLHTDTRHMLCGIQNIYYKNVGKRNQLVNLNIGTICNCHASSPHTKKESCFESLFHSNSASGLSNKAISSIRNSHATDISKASPNLTDKGMNFSKAKSKIASCPKSKESAKAAKGVGVVISDTSKYFSKQQSIHSYMNTREIKASAPLQKSYFQNLSELASPEVRTDVRQCELGNVLSSPMHESDSIMPHGTAALGSASPLHSPLNSHVFPQSYSNSDKSTMCNSIPLKLDYDTSTDYRDVHVHSSPEALQASHKTRHYFLNALEDTISSFSSPASRLCASCVDFNEISQYYNCKPNRLNYYNKSFENCDFFFPTGVSSINGMTHRMLEKHSEQSSGWMRFSKARSLCAYRSIGAKPEFVGAEHHEGWMLPHVTSCLHHNGCSCVNPYERLDVKNFESSHSSGCSQMRENSNFAMRKSGLHKPFKEKAEENVMCHSEATSTSSSSLPCVDNWFENVYSSSLRLWTSKLRMPLPDNQTPKWSNICAIKRYRKDPPYSLNSFSSYCSESVSEKPFSNSSRLERFTTSTLSPFPGTTKTPVESRLAVAAKKESYMQEKQQSTTLSIPKIQRLSVHEEQQNSKIKRDKEHLSKLLNRLNSSIKDRSVPGYLRPTKSYTTRLAATIAKLNSYSGFQSKYPAHLQSRGSSSYGNVNYCILISPKSHSTSALPPFRQPKTRNACGENINFSVPLQESLVGVKRIQSASKSHKNNSRAYFAQNLKNEKKQSFSLFSNWNNETTCCEKQVIDGGAAKARACNTRSRNSPDVQTTIVKFEDSRNLLPSSTDLKHRNIKNATAAHATAENISKPIYPTPTTLLTSWNEERCSSFEKINVHEECSSKEASPCSVEAFGTRNDHFKKNCATKKAKAFKNEKNATSHENNIISAIDNKTPVVAEKSSLKHNTLELREEDKREVAYLNDVNLDWNGTIEAFLSKVENKSSIKDSSTSSNLPITKETVGKDKSKYLSSPPTTKSIALSPIRADEKGYEADNDDNLKIVNGFMLDISSSDLAESPTEPTFVDDQSSQSGKDCFPLPIPVNAFAISEKRRKFHPIVTSETNQATDYFHSQQGGNDAGHKINQSMECSSLTHYAVNERLNTFSGTEAAPLKCHRFAVADARELPPFMSLIQNSKKPKQINSPSIPVQTPLNTLISTSTSFFHVTPAVNRSHSLNRHTRRESTRDKSIGCCMHCGSMQKDAYKERSSVSSLNLEPKKRSYAKNFHRRNMRSRNTCGYFYDFHSPSQLDVATQIPSNECQSNDMSHSLGMQNEATGNGYSSVNSNSITESCSSYSTDVVAEHEKISKLEDPEKSKYIRRTTRLAEAENILKMHARLGIVLLSNVRLYWYELQHAVDWLCSQEDPHPSGGTNIAS